MSEVYLNDPVYIDDTFYDRGSIIETWDAPGHVTWVPQNEPARRAMQERLDLVTYGARMKAELSGRSFGGLSANPLDDAMRDRNLPPIDPRYAPLPVRRDPGEVPQMPQHEGQTRAPGRPRKLVVTEPATAAAALPGSGRVA